MSNNPVNSCTDIVSLKSILPGTPGADVECHFGLRFRLIGAAPLAELTAGRSQARHALHPQVIQVLWEGSKQRDTRRDRERRRNVRKCFSLAYLSVWCWWSTLLRINLLKLCFCAPSHRSYKYNCHRERGQQLDDSASSRPHGNKCARESDREQWSQWRENEGWDRDVTLGLISPCAVIIAQPLKTSVCLRHASIVLPDLRLLCNSSN